MGTCSRLWDPQHAEQLTSLTPHDKEAPPLEITTPGGLLTVPLGGLHGPPHTADVDMDVRVHQDMSEAAGTHAGHSAFL